MDVAGTAVGIASLGIQVCQSLLDYYDKWKDYSEDVTSALQYVGQTKAALSNVESLCLKVDAEKTKNVISAVQACSEHIIKLQKKVKKLKTYEEPKGWREMLATQLQKAWYPLRHETLEKLRRIAKDIQDRLVLSLQILDLDLGTETLQKLSAQGEEIRHGIEQIALQTQETQKLLKSDQFRDAIRWLDAADPQVDYKIAQDLRQDGTGLILIGSKVYSEWKEGSTRHLWIHGKAGCGKSIASAIIIEDIERYCWSHTDTGYAIFYFTFNNTHKQSYSDCLRSLIYQLRGREPALSLLLEAHKTAKKDFFEEKNMEEVVVLTLKPFSQFYLILDALDEVPEYSVGKQTVRQKLLHRLNYLSEKAMNLRIIATSRPLEDIEEQITKLSTLSRIDLAQHIDEDIRKYIATQLAEDSHLSLLNQSLKSEIMDKLLAKADGMFRWVYCQMQDLKTLQSTRPSRIKAVLDNLPATLDETYDRMLARIQPMLQEDALIYLRWLAYAEQPLALTALAETVIIDASTPDGTVNMGDRGSIKDIQQLLSGLILIDRSDITIISNSEPLRWVRLAHYSVKEYLESRRIMDSRFENFHLDGPIERRNIAHGCLIYLQHYANHELTTGAEVDFDTFPLLRYAADRWYKYPNDIDTDKVVKFLRSQKNIEAWTKIYQPEFSWRKTFLNESFYRAGNGVYHASYLGLVEAVQTMLLGSDADTAIGACDGALDAAAFQDNVEIMRILIEKGRANIDSQSEYHGPALVSAAMMNNEQATQILIANGANVNIQTQYRLYGTALIAAIGRYSQGNRIIQMLLEYGADVNVQVEYGRHVNALTAAVHQGAIEKEEEFISTIVKHNMKNTDQIASDHRVTELIQMLIEHGANVNAQVQYRDHGTALMAAVATRRVRIVEALIKQFGADINARTSYGNFKCALAAAFYPPRYSGPLVRLLLGFGANIYDIDAEGMSALHWIACHGDVETFQTALALNNYDLRAKDIHGRTILHSACMSGNWQMLKLVLDQFSSLTIENLNMSSGWTVLHWACQRGSFEVLKLLSDAGFKTCIIETEDPAASWTPLDIAVHYGNLNLFTKDGNLIESYDWSSILPSGIVQLSAAVEGSRVTAVRQNEVRSMTPWGKDGWCDGCHSVSRSQELGLWTQFDSV